MSSVKEWYTRTYPTDKLGEDINPSATFEGLYKATPDVYEYLGVGDSLIRERAFEELAYRKKIDYDRVYNKWFNGI